MTILENDQLRVTIRPQGAELTSLYHKPTQTEHLWQADPAVWGWHAPNLFPVVGACLNDELLIHGQAYPMPRHGFARHSEFTVKKADETQAVFVLHSNEQTRAAYPYEFEFRIGYYLDKATLTIAYQLFNDSDEALYFSVGGHPAFRVPFREGEVYEDYFLEFQKDEPLERHLLSAKGFFTGDTESVLTADRHLPLTEDLFDRDALVFKNLESRRVTIRSRHHDHRLAVGFTAFPYLGLWAKPGAPFVCIEPWLGCADRQGTPQPIEQKEGIQRVDAHGQFEAGFTIGIESGAA